MPKQERSSAIEAATARRTRTGAFTSCAIAALAVLVTLAGCGKSAPSKSEYSAKADAICTKASSETAPLIREVTAAAVALESGKTTAVPQLTSAVQHLHEVAASNLAELQKLKQPSGESEHAAIARFLTPYTALVSAIGEAASELEKGQPQQAVASLEQVRPTSEQATAGAKAYGLTKCETVLAALS